MSAHHFVDPPSDIQEESSWGNSLRCADYKLLVQIIRMIV